MNDNAPYEYRRPRMDAESHKRILGEIAHIGRPDPVEITDATAKLREVLLGPLEVPEVGSEPSVNAGPRRSSDWTGLERMKINGRTLERNLVITASRIDPAYASFDVLRTRLVQALADKGWTRVAITSPTAGCGKSFTAVNLAMTLSRYDNSRTLLMDMDLRRPALARYLGAKKVGNMGDVLRGDTAFSSHLKIIGDESLKIGDNLAVGLNESREAYAAELFQRPKTRETLEDMESQFKPDVILYDLPPALAQDDVLAFSPFFDCILMVVGGGITTAKDLKEANRRLGDNKPILGVVLNMAEDQEGNTYSY